MKLSSLVTEYVRVKQAGGADFGSSSQLLQTFCRRVGDATDCSTISGKQVKAFLDGDRPPTRYWHRKYSVLLGFYRFAMSRGYICAIPLPVFKPKALPSLTPYIYSLDEIKSLLEATSRYRQSRFHIEPHTFRTLLLLLYGAGLRLCEALRLTLADVDLEHTLLIIHKTKFYKTRFVPIGADLRDEVDEYLCTRQRTDTSHDPSAALLVDRHGKALLCGTVRRAFAQLRVTAGVSRNDGARYQPRLHDLRHSFAVHRLTTWYREGANVQKLLPRLSTYLGHTSIVATQVYLTMTPDLLGEASLRFEQYACKGEHDVGHR